MYKLWRINIIVLYTFMWTGFRIRYVIYIASVYFMLVSVSKNL